MSELLKDKYNYASLYELALRIKLIYHSFQTADFINDIMDQKWNDLELKNRMRKITINLGKYLPNDYEQALRIIDKVIDNYPPNFNDFTFMYFPNFIEVYGQDDQHWDLSISALEKYTKCSTSEFAVRPFIIKNEKRMMQQMVVWSKHENAHVRRLASEGCRPQLPWGQALVSFKKNPLPIFSVLEQLKTDSSLYVRKSVANNLNDISKTHPDLVIKIARDWYGKNKHTDWIIKQGCRTLLKKGNKDALAMFGFANVNDVNINAFALKSTSVTIGSDITFSFEVIAKKASKLRLEYCIDYVKANDKRNQKIFQISELFLKENVKKSYTKKHSFANLSTRKHYLGIHSIALIVNGIEQGKLDFDVLNPK